MLGYNRIREEQSDDSEAKPRWPEAPETPGESMITVTAGSKRPGIVYKQTNIVHVVHCTRCTVYGRNWLKRNDIIRILRYFLGQWVDTTVIRESWAYEICVISLRQATTRQCDNVLRLLRHAKILKIFAPGSQNGVSAQSFRGAATDDSFFARQRCQVVATVCPALLMKFFTQNLPVTIAWDEKLRCSKSPLRNFWVLWFYLLFLYFLLSSHFFLR